MHKISKIAVITEISTLQKNKAILQALEPYPFKIINAGMNEEMTEQPLTYIETAFIAALLIHINRADFIIGGCGTGQGFLNAVMQYPGIFCGLIADPLDGWLFTQINGGNAISLALNKGYGWAGDKNLEFIFEKIFNTEIGCGYPDERKTSQKQSRERLAKISRDVHLEFDQIIGRIEDDILLRVFGYPGITELIGVAHIDSTKIKASLTARLDRLHIPY